jgi:hypothetical protein
MIKARLTPCHLTRTAQAQTLRAVSGTTARTRMRERKRKRETAGQEQVDG